MPSPLLETRHDGHLARAVRACALALTLVALCATCDASTALAPPQVRMVGLTWVGDTLLIAGSTQPADVAVTIDGAPYPVARLRFTSSAPDIVAIGPDGYTLEAKRIGTAAVTAQLLDATLPSPAPSLVTTLVVSPAGLRLGAAPDTLRSLGDTVRLTATATDVAGNAIPGITVGWVSADTTIAGIDATGLVTARANGVVEVRASVGTTRTTTSVTVRQRAVAVRFSPAVLRLDAFGADTVVTAVTVDARGNTLGALAASLSWTSATPAIATVSDGRITAVGNGLGWVRVTSGTLQDSLGVEVRQRAARVVVETPAPIAFQSKGESMVLRARAYDRRDNEVLLAAPTWRSLNPLIVHVEAQSGIATALAEGSATLVATLDDAMASAEVAVADLPARLVLEPEAVTATSVGDTLRLTWAVRNARGVDIAGVAVTLTSSDSTVARALTSGRILAAGAGTARVIASTATGIADTSLVTVVDAVAQLSIIPDVVTMASIGDTVVPAASIRNERGTELPRSAATWTSDDAGVARVSAGGIVIATGTGETMVRAASPYYPDRRDSVTIVVTNAAATVVIERDVDVIGTVGAARTYAAEVRNARGALIAVTPEWRALDVGVARVSTTGLVTAVGVGTARIVATSGSAADTLVLTVRNDVTGVELTPATTTVTSVGDVLYLAAVARNSVGEVVANPALTWSTTDTTVLRAVANGGVLAVGTGVARVVVASGALADTAIVTVVNAVAQVAIVPGDVTLLSVGDTVIPAASIRNEQGAELARTAATWSSDDLTVARVTTSGAIIAVGMGETRVRATSPQFADRRDSVTVIVTNAPASIVIERDTDLFTAVGTARTYTAEVRNARGGLIAVGPDWRTLDPAVASVSTSGAVTSSGAGIARIVASAGAVADTLVLTVRDDVASIELTPATAALTSLGDVLYPTATARNARGGVVAAPVLSWSSADTTVAKLQPDGGIVATGIGSTRIVVASGAVADTLALSVANLPVLIDITGTADTITAVGDSVALSVIARNARGDALSTATLAWSVDDPVVARVSSQGVVTARAPGATHVRASGGTAQDSIRIVVTNEPAAISMTLAATGAPATFDTMTATGQALQYSVSVFNGIGLAIAAAPVAWSSTNLAVAQVSPGGVATATGLGSAFVIATAGTVADSVRIVVVDPSRIHVDNSVVTAVRFGTLARPYATIQDGVNAATADDTVLVHRGNGYSEAVTLGRRVTLLGDSAAYVAGARDPLLLPLLRHDLGQSGITTSTAGASYTIRYLGIQHSVDGDAITSRDADNVVISDVYVNPVPGFRTGRGILIDGATGSVSVRRSRIDSVYAYGLSIRDAGRATIDLVTVRGVAARSGFAGAGIEVRGGTPLVSGVTVRRTAGPQVLFSRTTGASLLTSTFVGEQQLVRLDSVGSTTVQGNSFDMRRQAGEASPARGGGVPDPSGLEIIASSGVLVDANTFTDVGGQTSDMDGVRLDGVRIGTSGAAHGALLTANRFRGSRVAVRSARSTWTMTGSRVDSANVGVLLADADTMTLERDTIMTSRTAAVQSTGTASVLAISELIATGAQRAFVVSGAARVMLRNSTINGAGVTGAPQLALGSVDISATTADVVGNSITGVRGWTGLVLRNGAARADSNVLSRNLVGIRFGIGSVPSFTANAVFDNDTLAVTARRSARGAINDGAPRVLGNNWWGAPEGPQSDAPLSPAARGDSVIGGITTGVLAAPIAAHRGGGTLFPLRKIAGDGQPAAVGVATALPLTVRAVDAAGRPLAGVAVTFRVLSASGDFATGGGATADQGQNNGVIMTSDNNGLASATFVPAAAGTATITVTAGSGGSQSSVTFTVIVN